MKSLEEFTKDSNSYDNRLEFLEKWIVRKEREMRERDKVLPANFHKTDGTVYKEKEEKEVLRRHKVLEQIARRKYSEISKDALSHITSKLCKRLYLFDGEYPKFAIDLVKELLNHPNISTTDKQVTFRNNHRLILDARDIFGHFQSQLEGERERRLSAQSNLFRRTKY